MLNENINEEKEDYPILSNKTPKGLKSKSKSHPIHKTPHPQKSTISWMKLFYDGQKGFTIMLHHQGMFREHMLLFPYFPFPSLLSRCSITGLRKNAHHFLVIV